MGFIKKLRNLMKRAASREPVSGTAVIWDSQDVESIIEAVVNQAVDKYIKGPLR